MIGDNIEAIALIGFGEAASAFLVGWGLGGSGRVSAYDLKIDSDAETAGQKRKTEAAGAVCAFSPAEALAGANLAFSLVTADQAVAAAMSAAPHMKAGALWFDCNSCSPGAKRKAAQAIASGAGRYVDVAVMAPVHPQLHRAPLLVSGPDAEEAVAALRALGMRPEIAGGAVGEASSIKMMRSVMIKGIEALTAECLLAARKAGVESAVLASLQASDPGFDWTQRSAYNLERMMAHGARRAAEMREVAATLRELGLPDRMAQATAHWQAEIAGLGLDGGEPSLQERADRILKAGFSR
jgi:3-hydroxyisobutyrate dehydrogenase-like beta-hydroxyacid dehydrogenase